VLLLGYQISTLYPELPVEKQTIINTINPHSYCVAKKDDLFRKALRQAEILIPDGFGIVLAAKMICRQRIARIAGSDIHQRFLDDAQRKSLKVFYLGSSERTLQRIAERVNMEYPSIQVNTYSPPYKPVFSGEENLEMIRIVNNFAPDILFVGMTAPKQEKWVHEHKAALNVKVICAIGAVFDFYAGTVHRPGIFWQRIGLEWMPRLICEPRRLWRRTLISMPLFLLDVLIEMLSRNADTAAKGMQNFTSSN